MNAAIRGALRRSQTIDITTTGRRTGQPRRIEIWFQTIDDRVYISGMPRADRVRAWLRNLEADPRMTFHLKGDVVADLPARARIITDPAERRAVLAAFARAWRRDLDEMVASSPLIEVIFEDTAVAA